MAYAIALRMNGAKATVKRAIALDAVVFDQCIEGGPSGHSKSQKRWVQHYLFH